MKVEIDEGDRQLILLALATLDERSPGFDGQLNQLALKFDQVVEIPINGKPAKRAAMYDGFRGMRFSRFRVESADQLIRALRNVTGPVT